MFTTLHTFRIFKQSSDVYNWVDDIDAYNVTTDINVNAYVTCLMIKDDSLGDTVLLLVDGFTYLLHLEMCKNDKSYCMWNSLDFISIFR